MDISSVTTLSERKDYDGLNGGAKTTWELKREMVRPIGPPTNLSGPHVRLNRKVHLSHSERYSLSPFIISYTLQGRFHRTKADELRLESRWVLFTWAMEYYTPRQPWTGNAKDRRFHCLLQQFISAVVAIGSHRQYIDEKAWWCPSKISLTKQGPDWIWSIRCSLQTPVQLMKAKLAGQVWGLGWRTAVSAYKDHS